ncbi:MAG: S8 family serine peptidase [Anaerolineaceae bacterium]|jgi:serine protease
MSHKKVLIVFTLILMLLASVASPVVADPPETARIWVSYKDSSGPDVLKMLTGNGAKVHYDFPELGAYVVSVPAAALNGILNNPFVIDVEEDALRYPIRSMESQVTSEAYSVLEQTGQIVPYGIDLVQARDVWDANRDGVVDTGAPTGANRTLCIIDSGYYQGHEDLPNAVGGYSQVDDDWSRDGNGHGSHVGGTITAENNPYGVVGVTPGTVNLYIVKFFNDSGQATYASNLVDALSRCRNAGANVVSMSLGGSRYVRAENTAFQNAYNAGVLSIAAAGNSGNTALSYPASYTSVMSVAAVDSNMNWASFSQYNNQVEIAAPGVSVLSTVPYLDTNKVTVSGVEYNGGHLEYSARGTASGALADGGLCGTTGSWSGKVVLCQRGEYDFFTKVNNVKNSGGVAAIVYNNVPGDFGGTLGDGNSSSIIGVSLSQEAGQFLVANRLGQTATVSSSFTQPASGYEYYDGTSMATPHVSAVAALVWSAAPNKTNVEIREALTTTALDLGAAGRDVYYGYGLVQAKAAVDFLVGTTPPIENTAPTLAISSPANNSSYTVGDPITFTASASDAEDGNLSGSIVWKLNGSVLYNGASFTKSDLPVGTHTLEASVVDSGGLTASQQVTVNVTESSATQALSATITTNASTYFNFFRVYGTVTVVDQNGAPVESASVSVLLTTANGTRTTFTGTTRSNGVYTFSYRINARKTGYGTYLLEATVTKNGYLPASASTSFLVR